MLFTSFDLVLKLSVSLPTSWSKSSHYFENVCRICIELGSISRGVTYGRLFFSNSSFSALVNYLTFVIRRKSSWHITIVIFLIISVGPSLYTISGNPLSFMHFGSYSLIIPFCYWKFSCFLPFAAEEYPSFIVTLLSWLSFHFSFSIFFLFFPS